jgi:hypothetical protein
MATKKQTNEVPEGFEDMTKTEPITEAVLETPAVPAGQEPAPVITSYHPLSEDEVRRVNQVKATFDGTISMLKILRDTYHDAEVQRMFSVAITNAETASMWAVRGITYRG